MKNRWIPAIAGIVIVISLFFNLYHIYKAYWVNMKVKMLDAEKMTDILRMRTFETNFYKSYLLNDCKLNDFSVQDTSNVFKLSKLLDGRAKLVFFFSESYCGKCYEFELANLANDSTISPKDIIVIGAFQNKRTYLAHLQFYKQYSLPTYYVSDMEESISPMLNFGSPVYFIYDESHTTKAVFFPDRNMQDQTKVYFKILQDRYLK
jgi:hypothetical protein